MIRRKFKKNKKIALMTSVLAFSVMSATGYGVFSSLNAATGGKITAENAGAQNAINLKWNAPNSNEPFTYMVYSKGPGESVFQSIPTKDNIRVLNVYPFEGADANGNRSDGLKTWMETNGYGKGKIKVDKVYIDDFNANPSNYLGSSHNWKYDVVYFGAWDSNGNKDINTTSLNLIKTYLNEGRGMLLGHDTIQCSDGVSFVFPNFGALAPYVNITKNNAAWLSDESRGNDSNITVRKKGLLTTYPWDLGAVGTTLKIPFAHNTGQIAGGDIWMDFNNVSPNNHNHYLATWNNAAMIQTGHSGGQATEDEQKLTANALFYLAQVTEDTSSVDHKAMDKNKPNAPSVSAAPSKSDKNITFNISGTDNGTDYEYYVESTGSTSHTKYTSPTVKGTSTSGIKGYAYVVDGNPSTDPGSTIKTTSKSITGQLQQGKPTYIHVRAIDNAGNVSDVTHYKFEDKDLPNLSLKSSNTNWTKSDVVINATASDKTTGIASITTPNNAVTNGASASYSATENGAYTFTAKDNAGNTKSESITISNIDKTGPEVNIDYDKSHLTNGWSSKDINLTITASDNQSGVKNITLPNGEVVNGSSATYKVSSNGTYTFKSEDNVGNITTKTFEVGGSNTELKIDKTAPTIMTEYDHASGWTNEDITVNISVTDAESGVKDITLPDETVVSGDKASFTIAKNGTYTIMATDNAGNTQYYDVVIDAESGDMKIDKKAPLLNLATDKKNGWVKDSITITAKASDSDSGVDYIILPDGTKVTGSTARYSVSKAGTYKFETYDKAGNKTEKSIEIGSDSSDLKFDNTAPSIKIDANTNDWTSESLPIKITATDTESGVKAIITPDNVEHKGDSYTFIADINGTYTFKAVDNVGNESTQSVTVTKIDRDKPNTPSIGVISAGDKWINTDYHPSITATDDTSSGVKEIQYKVVNKITGEVAKDWSTYDDNTMISSEGDLEVHYRVISNSNVASDDSNFELKIDKTNPSITLDYTNPTEWNPDGVAIHFTASDSLSGVKEVVLPDGKRVNLTNGTFMAMKNGEYEFTVIDNAGNSFKQVATIKNVDTNTPSMPEITNGTHTGGGTGAGDDSSADKNTIGWLNHDYLPSLKVESNTDSGIKEIKYRISDKATGKLIKDWDTYRKDVTKINEEGISKVDFKVISNSGKESEVLETTVKIDKTKPEFKAENVTPTNSLARKVKYNLLANDTISGVNSITLPDGTKTDKDIATVSFDQSGTYEAMAIDNATNSEKVKITIPEGVNENANKVVIDLSKILEEYKPTNDSSKEELKQYIRDKLPDYDVDIDNFSKRDATENEAGNLTTDVTIKDSEGNSITDSLNKTISKLPQSVETAKSEMEKILLNFKATNDTEAIDILKKVSRVIKNPNIFPTIENFHKDKATIDKSGIITGTLILKDNKGHSDSINLNLPIDKLIQTVEDAKSRLQENLGSITMTNDTKEEDIIEQVRKFVVNPDIDIKVNDLKIDKATELAEGKGTCIIVLTDKDGNKAEIPLEATIAKLPQTLDGLLDLINSHLKDIPATNSTTADDIIDYLNQYITNSKLTIKLDNFSKDVATIYGNGNIKGLITVVDSEAGKEGNTNLDLTINKLESNSSEDDKKDYYENKDNNSNDDNPSNDNPSSIDDVIEDLSDLATGKTSVQELPKTEGIGIISVGASVFELLGVGIYMIIRKFKRK